MSSVQETVQHHLSSSPFPLAPHWDAPHRPWHACYPEYVPPALEYTPLRVERLLLCANDRYPDRMAIRYFRSHWTYSELVDRIRLVAANFQRLGVSPGDRILMALPNCPEFVVAWFALHWLGAQVVPVNPLCSVKELLLLAEVSRARVLLGLDVRLGPVLELTRRHPIPLLIVASLASHLPWQLRWPYQAKCWLHGSHRGGRNTRVEKFDALYRPDASPLKEPLLTDASLPAILQPTGGTTGTPKVAVLTHQNLHANVAQLHVWSGLKPGTEVVLAVLPFFHVFGSTVALLSSIAGGSTLLLQARFKPSMVWKVMERWRPSVAPMVPFMFASLCEQMERRGRNITGLKTCFCGASALSAKLKEDFQRRTGARVLEGYGLSETSPVTHTNPPDDNARTGSVGLPLPGTDARIVDPETGETELPPGEVGELVVRGPQVMAGYLENVEETAHVLRDGWLHTGDLACMDEDGFLTLVDRKKDIIISGGLNIYPSEIEHVLASHPSVQECAVVGTPDDLYGERPLAYVVPAKGAKIDLAQLEAYCRDLLAGYKFPRTIEVCETLPKTFLGKVRRVDLRPRAA